MKVSKPELRLCSTTGIKKLDYYIKGKGIISNNEYDCQGFFNEKAVVSPHWKLTALSHKQIIKAHKVDHLNVSSNSKGEKFINLNGKVLRLVGKLPQSPKEAINPVKVSILRHLPKKVGEVVMDPKQSRGPSCLTDTIQVRRDKKIITFQGMKSVLSANNHRSANLNNSIALESSSSSGLIPSFQRVVPTVKSHLKPVRPKTAKATAEVGNKLLSANILQVLNKVKMQALNLSMKNTNCLTKSTETSVQTEAKELDDKVTQTDSQFWQTFESFDFDILISADNTMFNDVNNEDFGSTMERKLESGGAKADFGSNLLINNKKRMFFNDLRMCMEFDTFGFMPIHQGVFKNDLPKVQRFCAALLARKVGVDVLTLDGLTPLQMAIIYDADTKIVQLLLDCHADLQIMDEEGNTALHSCAKFQRLNILQTIIDHAALKKWPSTVDSYNFQGLTPLMMACVSSWTEGSILFIKAGSDVNLRDQTSGRTALFHAAEAQNDIIVRNLLDNNANPKVKNFFGTSPHDAMYELEEMKETIKQLIFGKSKKRSHEAEMNPTRTAKAAKSLKTYSKLQKISSKEKYPLLKTSQFKACLQRQSD